MQRRMKVTIILLIILMLLSVSFSYALDNSNVSQDFFTVNKQKISAGETLEISINLNQIQWNQTKFTLSSDLDISGIYSNEENGVQIGKYQQSVTLEIDKSKLNLEKIVLYYPIPQEMEVGTTFILQGKIENLEQNNTEQTETEKTSEITVEIVENTKTENNEQENSKPENNNTSGDFPKENQFSNDNSKMQMSTQTQQNNKETTSNSLQVRSTSYNNVNTGNEEVVVYEGSNNNYLNALSINGYELNKEFNKESSTYFVTVGEDVNSLEVIASVEESTATVCISGSDNLTEGQNKILITVTSENGNVRNYRIYVTKG